MGEGIFLESGGGWTLFVGKWGWVVVAGSLFSVDQGGWRYILCGWWWVHIFMSWWG